MTAMYINELFAASTDGKTQSRQFEASRPLSAETEVKQHIGQNGRCHGNRVGRPWQGLKGVVHSSHAGNFLFHHSAFDHS